MRNVLDNAVNARHFERNPVLEVSGRVAIVQSQVLRPHREARTARLAQRGGEGGEVAQQAAGVARVDDFLQPERLGGGEGRAKRVQPRLDAGKFRGRVGGVGKLGAVGGLDAAFQRQRAPAARWPGIAQAQPRVGLVRAAVVPFYATASEAFPVLTSPLGTKGCGEAGCAGSLPAVMNALIDALAEFGVGNVDMPATPEAVWRVMQASR